MLVSLAGCKGSGDVVAPDESGANEPVAHIDPETGEVIEFVNSDLAKVGVYDISETDLGFTAESSYAVGSGKTDDGAFFVVCDRSYEYDNEYFLLTMDDKGSLIKKTPLIKPVDSNDFERDEDVSGIYYNSISQFFDEYDITANYIDGVFYEYFHYAGDGLFEGLLRIYTGGYEASSKEYIFDVRWNDAGECTDVIYLPIEYGDGYIDRFAYAPDGKLACIYNCAMWEDNTFAEKAIVFSENRFEDTKNMVVAENDDLSTWLNSVGEFMTSGDKLMAIYCSVDDPYSTTVSEIDLDTFEPVSSYTLDQFGAGSTYPLGTTDDEGFIFYTGSGLEICRKDSKAEVLFDYINSDFRETGCANFVCMNGTDEFYLSFTDGNGGPYIAFCKHVAPEDVPDCNVVTFGATSLYGSMSDLIIDYNTKNTGTRIVYKDYQIDEKYTDYNADLTKLYEDMINGRMPDIVFVESYDYFEYDTLSRKGILADIGSLIDEDPEMSLEDYLPNVVDALKFDGKIYRLVPSFSVNTAYGSEEFLSGYENWNVDTFLEYVNALDPDEAIPFSMFEIRENFLDDMLRYNGYLWIDRDGYSCDFNDPSFGRLLGFAKTIPTDIDYESVHMQNYWDGSDNMTATGEIRVNLHYMSNFKDSYFDSYAACEGNAAFVGFPSPNSQSSVLSQMNSYVIKADSIMIKESWDFIKQLLKYDYQTSDNILNFPVLKDAFEVRMEDCSSPYVYKNEDGEEYEYKPVYYIGDNEIPIPFMTDDQIKAAEEFILGIDREEFTDPDLENLIICEINLGFENGDTPEEIASSIQVLVQNYLDEKKAG
jgi:ABC-type glycerol-3-phosphate transport system substrate-binding protein